MSDTFDAKGWLAERDDVMDDLIRVTAERDEARAECKEAVLDADQLRAEAIRALMTSCTALKERNEARDERDKLRAELQREREQAQAPRRRLQKAYDRLHAQHSELRAAILGDPDEGVPLSHRDYVEMARDGANALDRLLDEVSAEG